MKIYTEVNYKWLDGQLVEIDSKSFEYEGEVTHCAFGGGGGGGGVTSNWGVLKDIVEDPVGTVQDSVTSVTGEDPVGTILDAGKEGLETGADAVKEGLHDATDAGKTNLETGADAVKEGLHDATDAGKTNLEYGADAVSDGRDKLVNMFIEKPLEDVAEEATEGTKIDTFAKGSKGKKDKNNPFLAIQKGKKSARGSTKIRRTGTSSLKI
jgi:hypothetical protein